MADREGIRINRSLAIPPDELRFTFSTSGGPGGQHANKVATRVEIAWDVEASKVLGPRQRARLRANLGRRLDSSGTMRVASGTYRSQMRNRQAAIERFRDIVVAALREPKRRVPTAPSTTAVQRRLEDKRRRSQLKRSRKIDYE